MDPWPRIERLWRDVGDESPWYEKALWHAVVALKEQSHIPACDQALDWIENDLRERPQEVDPTIYEREADDLLRIAGDGRYSNEYVGNVVRASLASRDSQLERNTDA